MLLRATIAALLFVSLPLAAQTGPATEETRAAIAILRSAAEALGGGDRLMNARSTEIDLSGQLYWPDQGRTPAASMRFGHRQRLFVDWQAGQVHALMDFEGPESSFQRRATLAVTAGTDSLAYLALLSPHILVRQMLARPRDMRLVAREGGRATVAGPVYGRTILVVFDERHLPVAGQVMFNDVRAGDAVRSVRYAGYTNRQGWLVPQRVEQDDAGRQALDLAMDGFAHDGALPAWTQASAPAPPQPAAASAAALNAQPLAPGIHLLRQHGGADYHGLLVELDEGLMLLETPSSMGSGDELRRLLPSLSAKPLVYLAATHHHGDHSGGMAGIAREGMTVLATEGNQAFFRDMVTVPRDFAGYAPRRGTPAMVRALRDGERIGPVQFLNPGSLAHADEHMIFYFPEQRLLFQGDMARFNDDGSVEPARPHTCALLSYIERTGLQVDRIVGVHGRMGTMDDLRRSAALRDPPC